VAVGDIMLGGTAEEIMLKNGYDYPFKHTRHLFNGADIVIGNLEGPLTNSETPMTDDKQYLFRSPPQAVAPALRRAGFNAMNLANNHILDYGVTGMNDTIQSLDKSGIISLGAGQNLGQARAGRIIRTAHGDVALLGYSLTFPESFWATETRPGTAFGHRKQIVADIQRLSQQVDYIVVSFHWGREKTEALRPYQPRLARAAIDAGADVVLGHHPHILQAIETYKQGLIIYSLGNYVFGSYSQDARNSVVARINLHNGNFHSAELTPINVLNTQVIFQPRPLKGEAAADVIRHINQLSDSHKTQLEFYKHRGYLHSRSNKIQSMTLQH
jgi:poly-gamma-glutamate synthesis protein (capsule biosynthesis protein)